jgi:hypothetical protein
MAWTPSEFFIGMPLVSSPSGLQLCRGTAPRIRLLAPAVRQAHVDIEEIDGAADGVIDHIFERALQRYGGLQSKQIIDIDKFNQYE